MVRPWRERGRERRERERERERNGDQGVPSNENMEVTVHRLIGRPKLRWSEKYDMEKGVQIEEAQHRRKLRMKTRHTDPK